MKKALISSGRVIGTTEGGVGWPIPAELADMPLSALAFDGSSVVISASLTSFAISPEGEKLHIDVADDDWPVIDCSFDDVLVRDGDGWRIETNADRLEKAKVDARRAIISRANAFTAPILSKYPDAERAGWDKREAEARAIGSGQDKAAAINATLIIKALAIAAGEDTAATVIRAEAIVAKAEEFAAISAAVEIMRDVALAAIDAVEDEADMPATLDALKVQATALAAQYGLA